MLKNTAFCFTAALVYTAVLVYLSLGNVNEAIPETSISFQDKIFHFGAYVIFAYLWGYYTIIKFSNKYIHYAFLATLSFGVILETIQEIINPLRSYDIYDLIANCLGVVIGILFVVYYKNLKLK